MMTIIRRSGSESICCEDSIWNGASRPLWKNYIGRMIINDLKSRNWDLYLKLSVGNFVFCTFLLFFFHGVDNIFLWTVGRSRVRLRWRSETISGGEGYQGRLAYSHARPGRKGRAVAGAGAGEPSGGRTEEGKGEESWTEVLDPSLTTSSD